MDTAGEAHLHVQEQLGVYVLGALPPVEAAAVDRHLDDCPTCADQALDLMEVRNLLGRLGPDEVATIINHRPEPPVDVTPEAPTRPATSPRVDPAGSRPPSRPGTDRPRTGPSNDRPGGRGTPPRRRLVGLTGLVAAALVVGVGLGIGLAMRPPTEIALAGSETSVQTGASITVAARGTDRDCHLETEISGLTPGVTYRLHAVESTGASRLATEWTATTSTHRADVDLPIPARNLTSVTVTTADGSVVVTVRVSAVS